MVISKAAKEDEKRLLVRHGRGGPVSRRRPRSCSTWIMQLLEAQAALETAKIQHRRAQELATAEGDAADAAAGRAARGPHQRGIPEGPRRPAPDRADQRGPGCAREEQGRARRGDEPAVVAAAKQRQEAGEVSGRCSGSRSTTRSRERLEGGGEDQRPEAWAERVKLAEATIEQIKKKRDDLKKMIEGMKVDETTQEHRAARGDAPEPGPAVPQEDPGGRSSRSWRSSISRSARRPTGSRCRTRRPRR